MSTYFVMLREKTLDPAALEQYGPRAAKAAEGHSLTPLVVYGDMVNLEGEKVEGAVILEFPNLAAAHAWYHSPAYQEAVAFRHTGSKSRAFLVEGT